MNTRTSKLLIMTVLLASLGLAACNDNNSAQSAGKSIDKAMDKTGKAVDKTGDKLADTTDDVGDYMSDSAITAKVKSAILLDDILKVLDISVTTSNGVVKLTGTVDNAQSVTQAQKVVAAVKGVRSVNNALVVKASS
ncbi:MAG: BON domain-containing protein [Gammaproteobacteria bacterium]|jgi:hyperosmotically inducible protein|nr:BON domain-containing protein [Gammaproteobacteria bacterium]